MRQKGIMKEFGVFWNQEALKWLSAITLDQSAVGFNSHRTN